MHWFLWWGRRILRVWQTCFYCGQRRGIDFVGIRSVLPCNGYPPVVVVLLLILLQPRTPPFALRTCLLCIPPQVPRKFDAWLEIYFQLITDQLEAVSLIFLVPHAFVQLDAMGLLVVVFLAMGACVLLWLFLLFLLFLLLLARLGLLGFLLLAFARLALLLR